MAADRGPALRIRWSEHEARKPYARPFGVSFVDASGDVAAGIAVSGAELVYARHFQRAVLALAGEVYMPPLPSTGTQRAWLDMLSGLLPSVTAVTVCPRSAFDEHAGRVFSFRVGVDGHERCTVSPDALADYQEFQAAFAHAAGALYRDASVEAVDDDEARQARWWEVLRGVVQRPPDDERVVADWPWR